jgi:alpha-tubulin suppressor-like RCC1 family protein
MGVCTISGCDAPYLDCDGFFLNGCEVNPAANRNHCGGCGSPCGPGEQCFDSTCEPATPVDLAAGDNHTVVAWSNGRVTAWGSNQSGQLGNGADGVAKEPAAQIVMGLTDANGVAVGLHFSCAVRSGGEVVCWGRGQYGELGTPLAGGDLRNAPGPNATGITDAVEIAAGDFHACARHGAGTVSCWGESLHGRLGNGSLIQAANDAPLTIAGLSDVASISARDTRSCALTRSGVGSCWGEQPIGDGTFTSAAVPTPLVLPGPSTLVALVLGGGFYEENGLAIADDGRLFCWGRSGAGFDFPCGNGRAESIFAPEEHPTLTGVDQVEGNCARTSAGDVLCWGANDYGQAGNGTFESPFDIPERSLVPPLRLMAAGNRHVCAIGTDDVVRCVGYNAEGQLGDSTYENRALYRRVEGH